MIRVALLGVAIVIVVAATVILADRLINPAETPNETITSRFPEGWESGRRIQAAALAFCSPADVD